MLLCRNFCWKSCWNNSRCFFAGKNHPTQNTEHRTKMARCRDWIECSHHVLVCMYCHTGLLPQRVMCVEPPPLRSQMPNTASADVRCPIVPGGCANEFLILWKPWENPFLELCGVCTTSLIYVHSPPYWSFAQKAPASAFGVGTFLWGYEIVQHRS